MPAKPKSPTPVAAHKHKDKRANIPTEELRDFVQDQEKAPKTVLYPRDPSLDPQLVWKGKDEQDSKPLEVPAVPIYIQEKIHPQVLIENLRADARASEPESELLLFKEDFNGLKFEDLVEFYQHKDGVKWANRMILGDSLLVMNSLAEKEGLKGKVQMVYFDPPYGIKFGSNWQVSTRKRDVKDGKAEDATRQPEQIRAFRDTWKLGIHSYLAYLRDRLTVARELLTESGSLFVQIGDENVHLVRSILDEVLGSDNFQALIVFKSSNPLGAAGLPKPYDFIVWYGKNIEQLKYRPLFQPKDLASDREYRFFEDAPGPQAIRRVSDEELTALGPNPAVFRRQKLTSSGYTQSCTYDFSLFGRPCIPTTGKSWSTNRAGMERLVKANRLFFTGDSTAYKRYFADAPFQQFDNCWSDMAGAEEQIYVVQTGTKFIERCMLMTTDPGDLVLDPTCGSGTTAVVAEQRGRRWITCDTSRVSIALARTRLMAAKFPFYLLSDSPEGLKKESELAGKLPPDTKTDGDIKRGFVYKRVPHVTLKAIANNEEIDSIHAEFSPQIEKALGAVNESVKETWQEWEVPCAAEDLWSENNQALFYTLRSEMEKEADANEGKIQEWLGALNHNLKRSYTTKSLPERPSDPWPAEAAHTHKEFWEVRMARQKKIDASIACSADTELLYDQPYEDTKRIRVTGPFTVESLSPHRFLSADDNGDGTVSEQEARQHHDFTTMILENLKKAGVQNTRKTERLTFDRLESFAGTWLQATGEYIEKDSKTRRVAVCIGPEHGTVGPDLVKEAAKEAVQGVGFDLLIVCGFAFDPHVSEETKRYGKLAILPARMNPDLAMGDELLKKTGAGNLFTVFGEPDVEIRPAGKRSTAAQASYGKKSKDEKTAAAQFVAEIKGVDIYDPTTGQIRNSSTDDIACWFIDTDYNGESFFVRHAYFTGADEPYEKLKRALRADIDEAAWQTLYSTVSRPFDKPSTGKIAIKVINHYGDEVMKVYEV